MISSELLPICIAGEWRLGGGDVYESLYPATGEPIARLRAASLADVEEAIAGGKHDEAMAALKAAEPEIARSAQKGIVHANVAARKVSRLNSRVKALQA